LCALQLARRDEDHGLDEVHHWWDARGQHHLPRAKIFETWAQETVHVELLYERHAHDKADCRDQGHPQKKGDLAQTAL
ncbi:unnamed protein product, partial [Prorocentrum cordatum]